MEVRISILTVFLVFAARGSWATTGCWDETATAANTMFVMSPGGYEPSELTHDMCIIMCSNMGSDYKHAGTTGGNLCLCSEEATLDGTAGTTCDKNCEGDNANNCGGATDFNVDVASGGGPITGFVPVATPTANSPDVTFTAITSDNSLAEYALNANDGSPLIDVATNDVVKFYIPGKHYPTVVAGPPGGPIETGVTTAITVTEGPKQPIVECPEVTLPTIPFFCNFSFVEGTGLKAKVTFTDKAAAPTTMDVDLPDPIVVSIGTSPPKGKISSFELTKTFNDSTTDADTLLLADMFPHTMYLKAIEYHAVEAGQTLTVKIEVPTCTSPAEMCGTSGGYCAAEGTCSEKYAMEYECEAAEHFCSSQMTCQANTCATDRSTKPTYASDAAIAADIPITTVEGYGVYLPPTAIEIPKGSRISATGAKLTYRKAYAGEKKDLLNGVETDNRFYIQALAVERSRVDVEHTCPDQDEITANIESVTPVSPADSNMAKIVYCQIPIEGLEVTPDKLFAPTNEELSFKISIEKGSVVDLHCDFDDGNGNQTILNAVNKLNAPATTEYPHGQTFVTAGNYTVTVCAENKWSSQIDYGLNCTEVIVVILNKVTTDWTVEYAAPTDPSNKHMYAIDMETGTLDVQMQLVCTACAADATKYPTMASAYIEFGNGDSKTENFPETYAPVPFTMTYTEAKHYNVTVNISNWVNFEMPTPADAEHPVEIYQKITDLGVVLGFYREVAPDKWNDAILDLDGMAQLPMDSPVTFRPTMKYGSVKEYTFKIKENGTEIGRFTVDDPYNCQGENGPGGTYIQVTHPFPEEGLWNVTMTAISPVKGEDKDYEIQFIIVGDVRGVKIVDNGDVTKPNELKEFEITFESIGTQTCMTVDFGNGIKKKFGFEATCKAMVKVNGEEKEVYSDFIYDDGGGSRKELTTPFKISTTYAEAKTFNISVYAWNTRPSEDSEDLMFPVTNLPCKRPQVVITNAVDHPKDIAEPLLRSEQHVFATEATIDCDVLQTTKKRWEILKVINETSGETGEGVHVMNELSSWDKPQLVVTPRFLKYGFYQLKYSLTMWGDALPLDITFQGIAYSYIEITASPLVAILIAGGIAEIKKGMDQTFMLEPAVYSYDPDLAPGLPKDDLRYKWFCKKASEAWDAADKETKIPEDGYTRGTDKGGCFGEGKGPLEKTDGFWELKGDLFYDIGKYEVKVQVTKKDDKFKRMSEAKLLVEVVKDNVPEIVVKCKDVKLCKPPNQKGIFFNPDERLALTAGCVIGSCDDRDVAFKWSLKDCTSSPSKAIDGLDDYISYGLSNLEMSISKDLFGNKSEIECFEVTTYAENAAGQEGKVIMNLQVNKPPENGKCVLSDKGKSEPILPTASGTAGIDLFRVTCSGWNDPESKRISFYKGFYMDSENIRQEIFSIDTAMVDNLPFPAGKYKLMAEVIDEWGGLVKTEVADVDMAIPDKNQLLELTETKKLDLIVGSGDVTQLAALSKSIFQTLNDAEYLSLTESKTPEEVYDIQLEVAETKKKLLNAMATQMDMKSAAQRDMALSAAVEASKQLEASGPAGKTLESQGRQDIVDIIGSVVDNYVESGPSSPQKMQETLRGVLTASSGIFDNIASVIKDKEDGNCSDAAPPADVANPDELDYEPAYKQGQEPAFESELAAVQCTSVKSTKDSAKKQVEKLKNAFKEIDKQALKTSVVGETMDVSTPNGARRKIAKDYPGNFSEIDFGFDGAKIMFPEDFIPKERHNEPIGVVAGNLNVVPQTFASNAKVISRFSQSVSVEVYSGRETNEKMPIKDLDPEKPLTMIIPINSETMDIPEPELIDCNSRIDPATLTCYSQIKTESPEIVLIITFKKEDPATRFAIMVDFDHMPTPVMDEEDKSYERVYDFFTETLDAAYMKEKNIAYNDTEKTYTIVIRNTDPKTGKPLDRTGRFFMGVVEVKGDCTKFKDCMKDATLDNLEDYLEPNFTSQYSVSIKSSGCYYYNESFDKFSSDGMKLISASAKEIMCSSTHMTDFGTGFFVMPNTIDFSYVFANAGFTDNLTIYLTIIITVTLYIILLIWAFRADRKDVEKLGASPMPDNKMEDKYLYEIMVFTGHKTDASTDSLVSFVVSGDRGDTKVRTFGDPEREIFRKGQCNVFVMATPGPLGNLNYIRMWHDNSGQGGFASWFPSFIVFKDVQTGHKYEFIINQWFAVEEDDGQIDRVIPVAGLEQKSDFAHLFTTTSQKNLSDGHLWFSVFMRPPRSRFSRIQRVSACMALLYLSMLVNAMWYERVPDQPATGLAFGPFQLSVEQIGIGVMANLIVFPPSFLIVWLFRTSRPRKLRESRIDKALEKQGRGKGASSGWKDSGNPDPKDGSQVELVQAEQTDGTEEKKKKKKKKFTLPWFFLILAWLLVIICIGVSVFFLWAYGIMFGNEKTTQWITSLVISFFSSVLFVQPLKVFLLAVFFSALCKAVDQDSDDADEDEEDPTLASDEEYMHAQVLKKNRMGAAYCPLNEAAKREAKEKRIKEKRMMSILWELCVYFIYIMILLVLSYGNRDPNAYLLHTTFKDSFIKLGDRNYDYSKVNEAGKWWNWALNVVMNETRPQRYYNGKNPYQMRMFLNDYVNRLMGHGIIRQSRVKPDSCNVMKEARGLTTECAGMSSFFNEDNSHYCKGWKKSGSLVDCSEATYPEFRYTTASELKAFPSVKVLASYGGGGYVIRMKGSASQAHERMQHLMYEQWIDELTRAVFVEFYTYNAQVNLFGLATITAEFVPGGGIHPSWRFDGIRLLQYHQGFGLFVLVCEISFILFTIGFLYVVIKTMRKEKKEWTKSYWNWADLSVVIMSFAAIITYVVRMIETRKITKEFADTWGNGYIRLQEVYYIDMMFGYMIAYIVFVSTVRLIKLLRFNRRMGILSATLRHCWDDLTGFLFVFFLSFLAFVQMFYLFLFKNMYDFHNFLTAFESCFSMMLGKFSFEEMKNTSMFAAGMFFVFAIVMSVILINLFITIILRSFEKVKSELLAQPSEYQILNFMLTRVKAFIGFGGPTNTITPAHSAGQRRDLQAQQMNEKVDRMLAYINGIYSDGKLDSNSKEAMKKMYLSSAKPGGI